MRRFFARQISKPQPRDTDADWQIIGKSEPYFGVLTNPRFKRQALDEKALADFFATGRADVISMLEKMRALSGDFYPKSALDFGCGVGRLTRALAEVTGDAIGYDISLGMLEEARKTPVHGATYVNELPRREFDWVVSYIVLQHVTPEFGHQAISRILECVAPSGGITLHVTFARTLACGTLGSRLLIDNEVIRPSTSADELSVVPQGEILMHDYDLGRVVAQFFVSGFGSVDLVKTDHGGHLGAFIYARKD